MNTVNFLIFFLEEETCLFVFVGATRVMTLFIYLFCSNASIVVDFLCDCYFMISLFEQKFQ